MLLRNSKFLFFFIILAFNICYGEELKNSSRALEAFAIRRGMGIQERIEKTREIFAGLTDAEILNELMAGVFERDEKEKPPFDMRVDTASVFTDMLRDDKTLVSDDTALREAIKNETDARKFYLLLSLSWGIKSHYDVEYIEESRHMLFEHSQIAKPLQAQMRMQPIWGDVSRYVYQGIVNDLKKSGSSFVPPDDSMPHDEKVLILERWLTDNWSGRSDQSTGVENLKRPSRSPSEERKSSRVPGIEEVTETSRTQWPYYVAGFLFAISLLCLVKVRTSGES